LGCSSSGSTENLNSWSVPRESLCYVDDDDDDDDEDDYDDDL
jgi:hypothetical protein